MKKQALNIAIPIMVFASAFIILALGMHPKEMSHSDETYYLESAREMIQTGDYITPSFEGHKRFRKPILFYWIVIVSYLIGGDSHNSARLASIFFASLTITILFVAISRWRSRKLATLSSLAVIASYGFFAQSHYAMTDTTLNFFMTLALLLYWEVGNNHGRGILWKWGIFIAVALAILTKGPLGICIPVITVLVYALMTRKFGALKPILSPSGWLITALISLPWFILMMLLHRDEYLKTFMSSELAMRLASNGHSIFYLGASLLLFMAPWFLLLPLLIKWENIKKEKFYIFLIAWILSPFVTFALIPNKHSHYILPAVIPIIVLLTSLFLELQKTVFAKRVTQYIAATLLILTPLSLAAIVTGAPLLDDATPLLVYPAIFTISGVGIWIAIAKNRIKYAPIILAVMFLIGRYNANLFAIPTITKLPEQNYAKKLENEPTAEITTYKWRTKRLNYLLPNRNISEITDHKVLNESLRENPNMFIITDSEYADTFPQNIKDKLEVIDKRPYWKRIDGVSMPVKKLFTKDYKWFTKELVLLRQRPPAN